MMRYNFILIVLSILLSTLSANAYQDVTPEGFWLVERSKDVVVRIDQCGEELCGHIAWVDQNVAQETPGLCNLKVLSGLKQKTTRANTAKTWSGGRIYKADIQEYFGANMQLVDSQTIKLRGYVGLPAFGKTYIFKKVDAHAYPDCQTTNAQTARLTR